MKHNCKARSIAAASAPNGGYTTEDVLDYFNRKLRWDVSNRRVQSYADAVAEYMDMAYQVDPTYTMDDWYYDTKMNYPEEIDEFEANINVPIRSSTAIKASMRIENMYDVKTTLEELLDSIGIIEDNYFDIDETDSRYILKRYLYDVSRHLQAAYNSACKFIERDI